MKRIAVLSVHTCPLGHLGTRDTGGMNVYVRELSRELGRQGLLVDVFTRYRNCDHDCIVELGEGARLVHVSAGETLELSKYDLYEHLPEFIANVVHFQQSNALKYDLIHSHYWLSGWVGEILKACWGVPHLTTFHTLGRAKNLVQAEEREPELRLDAEERVLKGTDLVLALTTAERSLLTQYYGMNEDRVAVIPGGIDLEVFRPLDKPASRRELGLPQTPKTALYVGRLEPLKGVDILLKAMSLLPETDLSRCLIVGGNATDDGEVAHLRSLAEGLGVLERLSFLGPVEHERLPVYYSAADVTVVPSRYESFGLVALESLACGTPVVASKVGGLPFIVRHQQNGLLVPRPNPEMFAASLGLLLRDEALRRELASQATASVHRFNWATVRPRVLELYQMLKEMPRAA
ncbi:MAG: glycosyltransferase [Chloroflexota bacterium]